MISRLWQVVVLAMCLMVKTSPSVILEKAVKDLVGLVQQPQKMKGQLFTEIFGPKLQDRVCIVGAGPAGLHMAQSLKKRNFEDIIIFEKSNRVGGKSNDVTVDNTVNYMSTVFVLANYFNTLVPLAKQYGIQDLVKVPLYNIFRYNSGSRPGSKLRSSQYFLGQIQNITGVKDPMTNLQLFVKDVDQYVKIHQQMFGTYKGELMPRPSQEVLHRIRGTFLQFLNREHLLTLVPYFYISQTVPGYGYLDEIGALYGLMWNDPLFIVVSVLRIVGQDEDPLSTYIFRNGFERIWEAIVDVEKLDVKFNSNIIKIKRNAQGPTIYLDNGREELCGFLIWAAPIEDYLETVIDVDKDEFAMFKDMTPSIYSSTLVKMKSDIRNGPCTAFMENILNKTEHGVIVETSSSGINIPNMSDSETLDEWDNSNNEKISTVFQDGRNSISKNDLNYIMTSYYMQNFNASSIEILLTISWKYFPRWSPAELNKGRHWDVFNIQGRKKTWLAGSSVSFESVKSVLEYNNLLLRQSGL